MKFIKSVQYFCNLCKDKSWLISCTGCGGVLTRRSKWYDIRICHKGHSSKVSDRYQCLRCKDRNWLVDCKCGCRQPKQLRDSVSKIRDYISGHNPNAGRDFQKGQTPWNKKNFYLFPTDHKNHCKYCGAEIPWLNKHHNLQQYCKGHENKLKNPIWINDSLDRHIIPLKDTKPERILQGTLDKMNICFKKHKSFRIRTSYIM